MTVNGDYRNTRKLFRGMILAACILGFMGLVYCYGKVSQDPAYALSSVEVRAEDDAILIKWKTSHIWNIKSIHISVSDGELVSEEQISPFRRSYSFQEGIHGKLYTVEVSAELKDGTYEDGYEKKLLYLDYDRLPDLPTLIIETEDGEDPGYVDAVKPDDSLWGAAITENEYVTASLKLTGGDFNGTSSEIKIRVRGNTSAVFSSKNPYKIKLSDEMDLLGNGTAKKEWILLNSGTSIKTYAGIYVGTLCGMEWQTEMMFVNLILNGDWKGCYYLAEPVSRETAGEFVSESGFIFENDPYWWNSDDIYFKTKHQLYQMGYTFKYPKISDAEDERLQALQAYMQEFENYILNGDERYKDYIDEDSFAAWILARDILGELDGAGANMFLYKYDFDSEDPTSSKVKIGPLWDFDNSYSQSTAWSVWHTGAAFYFPQLFEQPSFRESYVTRWQEISGDLTYNMDTYLQSLYEEQGIALEESWALDVSRWGGDVKSVSEQISEISEWFRSRTEWMDQELELPE